MREKHPTSAAADELFSPESTRRVVQAVAKKAVEKVFADIAELIGVAEAKQILADTVAGLELPQGRPPQHERKLHLLREWMMWLMAHDDPRPMAFIRNYRKRFPGKADGLTESSHYRALNKMIRETGMRDIGRNTDKVSP